MNEIKRNNKGRVLFSSFKSAVNAETLDELNGYTIEIATLGGERIPDSFTIDKDRKVVTLKTDYIDTNDVEIMELPPDDRDKIDQGLMGSE